MQILIKKKKQDSWEPVMYLEEKDCEACPNPSYPHYGRGALQSVKNVHNTWTSFMSIVSTMFVVLKRHFWKHKWSFNESNSVVCKSS